MEDPAVDNRQIARPPSSYLSMMLETIWVEIWVPLVWLPVVWTLVRTTAVPMLPAASVVETLMRTTAVRN